MKEPRRLIDASDEFERGLLAASSGDVPSDDAYRRTLTTLGVGVLVPLGTAGAAHGAAGGALSSGRLGTLVLGKWLAAGLALGVATASGVQLASRALVSPGRDGGASEVTAARAPEGAPPQNRVHVESVVPAAPEGAEPPLLAVPGKVQPAPPGRAPRGEARPAPAASAPEPAAGATEEAPVAGADAVPVVSLRREMQLVDAARAAVRRGDARSALVTLAGYHSEFPHGELAPEASLLEISALMQSGQRERARALGERLIAADRAGQRAEAVRALLAGANKP